MGRAVFYVTCHCMGSTSTWLLYPQCDELGVSCDVTIWGDCKKI